ncbi:MAG: hypothetical protein V4805_13855 [Pseudomonadota bacterium]
MKTWNKAMRDGIASGAIAAAVSGAVLLASGKRENGTPFGAVNAISHWIWGDKAARRDAPSVRYTMMGYTIHHGASTLWATLYEKWFGSAAAKKEVDKALAGAMAVSALACFVDYNLTPHRLEPGYEMRLSKKSLLLVYTAFGIGLALRGLAGSSDLSRKRLHR